MYNNSIESIAIGTFDGLHVAHKTLIDQADGVVVIETNHGHLTPACTRSLYVNKPIFYYHLDKIRSLEPQEFVEMLKKDFGNLKKIVVGYDFGFGKSKKGDGEMLRELFGGEVQIVKEVSVDGIAVHSRTIKSYLTSGDIRTANRLLGRRYRITGTVIPGQGIGGKELVPTINLKVKKYLFPHEGVYATRTKVDGTWYNSVSFLGHRLSTDGAYAIETHIIGKTIELHNGDVSIEFVDFIRPNAKFESLEGLKAQIEADITEAGRILE